MRATPPRGVHAGWTSLDSGSGIAYVDGKRRFRYVRLGWFVSWLGLSRAGCVEADSSFHNVLIGLERSKAGERALRAAVDLASKCPCRLTLLAAYRTQRRLPLTALNPSTFVKLPSDWEIRDSASRLVQLALNRVGDTAPATSIVRESSFVVAVLERSMIAEHDLVILGVSRANRVHRRWLAKRITRTTRAKVLLVGPGSAQRLVGAAPT